MNLLEIRTAFVRLSGRYDLVVDAVSFADNGANFFINTGQRWLDRRQNFEKAIGRVFKKPTSGKIHTTFMDCRAVQEVWVADTEGRYQLDKKDMKWLREEYNAPPGTYDVGRPLYYAPGSIRMVPESDRIDIGDIEGIVDYMDVLITSQHYDYDGVVFWPPTDGTYMVEIWGLFYSPSLVNNADKSYWSVVHPSVSLMAAMRELEVIYRNSEGVKDWERAIDSELVGIDMDSVEEDIAEVNQMEG